jgi:predicted PurR-regulated permease PerM
MDQPFKIPFYARMALTLTGIFVFVYTMYIGQDIIIPVIYATIIAILLNPLVNYITRKKVNKLVAISIAVVLAMSAVVGLLYIISTQLGMFSETYPRMKEKFGEASAGFVRWVSETFSMKEAKVTAWLQASRSEAIDSFAIGEKLGEVGRILVVGLLLPVYLFMILYYKTLLLEFIHKLFRAEHHTAVVAVLTNSKTIIQSYLTGLVFEMIIIAVLNSVGLLLLGIDYAIILGIIGAVLNIIPYLGGVIAVTLPMIIALVTKDSASYSLLVLLLYLLIQFIDNNYIIPKIVSSRVRINALVSMIVVLIGGALWGIPGMFLSIPLTAILKVIFDHIEPLKPWGFLLGNIVPTASKFTFAKLKK